MIDGKESPKGEFYYAHVPEEMLEWTQGKEFFIPAPMAAQIANAHGIDSFREITLDDVLEFYGKVMMKGN